MCMYVTHKPFSSDDSELDDSDEDNQYYDNNLSDDSWMKNTGM